jgi:hypothetical protein
MTERVLICTGVEARHPAGPTLAGIDLTGIDLTGLDTPATLPTDCTTRRPAARCACGHRLLWMRSGAPGVHLAEIGTEQLRTVRAVSELMLSMMDLAYWLELHRDMEAELADARAGR